MNLISRSMLVFWLFLLGCATGTAASHFAAKAAAEPASQAATLWAYLCFKEEETDRVAARANKLGSEGWELVSSALSSGAGLASPIWCFKRPR